MKRDIFKERKEIQPYEYPELLDYMKAIQHSFWLPEHFTYDRDVLDFKVNLTPVEQDIVKKCMLAIGVVENKVKTFWARIDQRMPKSEIACVGHTFASNECFDDQTEVLTNNGFKLFSKIQETDKIAQYNLQTTEVSFAVPDRIISKEYSGDIHYYKSNTVDIAVTPNHELITIHPISRKRYKSKSKDGVWSKNYRFPVSGNKINGSKNELTYVERMLISLQADGSVFGCTPSGRQAGRRDVVWNLSKQHKIDRLINILDNTGLSYNKRISKRHTGEFTVISLRLPDFVDNDTIKNFGWVDLENITSNYVYQFIEELSYWDCHRNSENSFCYYNANETAVDKVQALAVLGGYMSYKSINRTADKTATVRLPQGTLPKSTKTTFRLSLIKREEKIYPIREVKYYEGMVYCVTVPEGNIITRRNKSVSVQGNCIHQLTYQKLLELLGLEKEFETINEVECMRDRAEYLTKYLKGVNSRSNKEFTKSLLLFTLLVENASLFSQFLIVSSFKKFKNTLTNFSSVISSTAREEDCHAAFGSSLINIIKQENPEWFDKAMEDKIRRNIVKAYKAECKVLDWIFEEGELDFLPKENIKEYLKDRFNKGLNSIGYDSEFEANEQLLDKTTFLEVQTTSSSAFDFFNEKGIDYSQNSSFNDEDIW